ncbi:MAG: DUF3667 domain-containing protein [Cyclobacteriaceae bacterium]|nr:DUF3667 domain-containing protein [Cyclobacteriaceae bacterium]
MWRDIQHGLFYFDKGILFTARELFTRPGFSIKEFIDGKRIKHFKPLSLVILLAGIYGFLSHYFDINLLSNNFQVSGSGEKFIQTKATLEKMSEWISQHYSILTLIQIPIFSLGTYIAFRKVGYNFIEHLVINSFIAGQKLIIRLITFPLFLWFSNSQNLKVIARFTDLAGYLIGIWTLLELFNQFSFVNRILRTILSLAIAILIIFILLTITSVIFLS